MTITFLGTASVLPGAGQDSPSLLIDDHLLVDCGWKPVDNLLRCGVDPGAIRYLLLTHCHQDHYMGLPHLLFYRRMRARRGDHLPALQILGPQAEVQLVVERARHFLRAEQFPDTGLVPETVGLQSGDQRQLGELHIECVASVHPVPGLCYRVQHTDGRVLALSGDTAPHPRIVEHVRAAQLLVHEAAAGPRHADPNAPSGHSGARQAAEVAREAGVERLALVHWKEEEREATLAAAREIFPDSVAPGPGDRLSL